MIEMLINKFDETQNATSYWAFYNTFLYIGIGQLCNCHINIGIGISQYENPICISVVIGIGRYEKMLSNFQFPLISWIDFGYTYPIIGQVLLGKVKADVGT